MSVWMCIVCECVCIMRMFVWVWVCVCACVCACTCAWVGVFTHKSRVTDCPDTCVHIVVYIRNACGHHVTCTCHSAVSAIHRTIEMFRWIFLVSRRTCPARFDYTRGRRTRPISVTNDPKHRVLFLVRSISSNLTAHGFLAHHIRITSANVASLHRFLSLVWLQRVFAYTAFIYMLR